MRFHSTIIGAAALGLMISPATAQDSAGTDDSGGADATVTKVEGWQLVSRARPGEPIDKLCVLSSPAAGNGLQVRIANRLNPDAKDAGSTRGAAQLLVPIPDKLSTDPSVTLKDVSFKVTGKGKKSWDGLTGLWKADNTILRAFVDDHIDTVLAPLSQGKELQVSFTAPDNTQKSYAIPLKGSYAAVLAYEQCLAGVTWTKPKK